mmetsp:Transcript_786/g.3242  ORF Transcript_786/g.3242 Transcript_786/m.3242 type:complete len:313 (-) Transcript_786:443-1381(-)
MTRAEKYPLKNPATAKSVSAAVISPPRLAGDKKPSTANTITTKVMKSSCVPVPTRSASDVACAGARNTSPCTSFHPLSSCASSIVSRALYLEMSRFNKRTRIMATMALRNSTTKHEFTTENQCTPFPSAICRYTSQRLAHLTGDSRNATSYVKTMLAPSSTFCGGTVFGSRGFVFPSSSNTTDGWFSAEHELSFGSNSFHAPLKSCLTETGATSNPTMRDDFASTSECNSTVNRRWLFTKNVPSSKERRFFFPKLFDPPLTPFDANHDAAFTSFFSSAPGTALPAIWDPSSLNPTGKPRSYKLLCVSESSSK